MRLIQWSSFALNRVKTSSTSKEEWLRFSFKFDFINVFDGFRMESGESPTDAQSPEETFRLLFVEPSSSLCLVLAATHFVQHFFLTRRWASNSKLWFENKCIYDSSPNIYCNNRSESIPWCGFWRQADISLRLADTLNTNWMQFVFVARSYFIKSSRFWRVQANRFVGSEPLSQCAHGQRAVAWEWEIHSIAKSRTNTHKHNVVHTIMKNDEK